MSYYHRYTVFTLRNMPVYWLAHLDTRQSTWPRYYLSNASLFAGGQARNQHPRLITIRIDRIELFIGCANRDDCMADVDN